MADTEVYSEFKKKEEQAVGAPTMNTMERVNREQWESMQLQATAEDIKREVERNHDLTRAAVQNASVDVLAAIKTSPAAYLKLICEFGSLFLLFSLAIRFVLKIELVNTSFSIFMLAAFLVYWAMVELNQRQQRAEGPSRENQK